ncbi:type I glyceraldehyde-3-phosphate dehydrogenase [Parvularcula oceani]|uniref:type I glyceraldehyde-3-phosphate dehydrogenase n=1 Tax=Parvularcula oceani TaxID=1247963 RepID=UPI0004E0E027|nr:type I glyceraldehyde-3-phosphate dehydrogenase [Parvularcula oceani]
MALKVGINGFGRIGRLALRSMIEHDRSDIEVVAINDLGPVETNAHLLKYDSVHGRLNADVSVEGENLRVNGKTIDVTAERDPSALRWGERGVDIVFECTGIFTDPAKAKAHLEAGAKRVLVSAPLSKALNEKTVVYGVNHDALTAEDTIVSNASCTTNCLAPVAKVLHEAFGIERGYMTTIHSYTGDQPTLDTLHKDLYRARAAASNMIPTSTGAAKAVGLVLPDLNGKLDGSAVRVPTPNVSMIDLVFQPQREASVEAVNDAIRKAADGELKGVLGYTDEKLVSSDFNHDSHSSTFATAQTQIVDGNLVRVLSWYDNEWGFSTRMADTALVMAKFL